MMYCWLRMMRWFKQLDRRIVKILRHQFKVNTIKDFTQEYIIDVVTYRKTVPYEEWIDIHEPTRLNHALYHLYFILFYIPFILIGNVVVIALVILYCYVTKFWLHYIPIVIFLNVLVVFIIGLFQ